MTGRGRFLEVVQVSEVADSDVPQCQLHSAPQETLEDKVQGG